MEPPIAKNKYALDNKAKQPVYSAINSRPALFPKVYFILPALTTPVY